MSVYRYIYPIVMQGAVDKRKELICFVPAQMLLSWCTCKMVVNIQTKHDAKTNFFYLQSWCEISEMTYPTQHMLENDMRFSYQSDFRIGIFYDSDSNSDSTRAYSDSDSDSKVYQNMWFQFWFWFQCFPKYLIPISIQTNQALIPILILESFTTL